jgi:excisionase family DNA binding protein
VTVGCRVCRAPSDNITTRRSECFDVEAHASGAAAAPPHRPTDRDLAGVAAEPLITKRGVSVVLGASERTVDRLVAAGRLRAYRIGGHRRLRLDDLEAFIAESEVRP